MWHTRSASQKGEFKMSKLCPSCGFENYLKTRYCNLCSEKLYTVYCSRCGHPKTHSVQTVCSGCERPYDCNEEMLISAFHTRILFKAIKQGDCAKVEECLFCNADVDAYNNRGEAPLHCAVRVGLRNTAELLLAAGADVNAAERHNGATPLHIAESREMAELLLLWGSALTMKDYDGRTPLQWAEEMGRYDIVELIRAARPEEVEKLAHEDFCMFGAFPDADHSPESAERVRHLEIGLKKAYQLIEKRESRISELQHELDEIKKSRQEIRFELVRVRTKLEEELSAPWWSRLIPTCRRSFGRTAVNRPDNRKVISLRF